MVIKTLFRDTTGELGQCRGTNPRDVGCVFFYGEVCISFTSHRNKRASEMGLILPKIKTTPFQGSQEGTDDVHSPT